MRGTGRQSMRCAAVLLLVLAVGCGGPKPAAKPVPAVKLTAANFESEVKAVRGRPVLVHFCSASCYHCKAVRRMLEQLQGDYGERLKVAELEIGSARGIAAPLKVAKAPTLLFFRDGEEVGRLEGGPNREAIEPMVERVLAGKPAGKPAIDAAALSDPAAAAGVSEPARAPAPDKAGAVSAAVAVEDPNEDPEKDPDVIEVMKGWEGTAQPEGKTGEPGTGGNAGTETKTGP